MEQGDILWVDDGKTNLVHPIIFIEKKDDESFYGCIISHEPEKGNVKMEPEHFRVKDEVGEPYRVQYGPSYLVFKKYIKKDLWITDETVKGKLTDEGIAFVLANTPPNEMAVFHPKPVYIE
ncbi:MAG: hypothetical protein LBM20_05510 [Rikenellaceae bacterium]|jgi:hypothetical protein|nr:hypothetical protein [Rikenellaceae bacterium]